VLLQPATRRKLLVSVLGRSAAEQQAAAAADAAPAAAPAADGAGAGAGTGAGAGAGGEQCPAEEGPELGQQPQQPQQPQAEEVVVEVQDIWQFKRTCEVCAGPKSRL
jgi:hypothetical protein